MKLLTSEPSSRKEMAPSILEMKVSFAVPSITNAEPLPAMQGKRDSIDQEHEAQRGTRTQSGQQRRAERLVQELVAEQQRAANVVSPRVMQRHLSKHTRIASRIRAEYERNA